MAAFLFALVANGIRFRRSEFASHSTVLSSEESQLASAEFHEALQEQSELLGTEANSVLAKLSSAKETLLEAVEAEDEAKPDAAKPALKGADKTKLEAHSSNSTAPAKKDRKAQLAEGSDMLANLFAHLKKNIAKFNERETEGKQESQKVLDRLRTRLAEDKKKLADPKLPAFEHELLTNRTQMEEREVKYWESGRDIQHHMFHANLKLTHGLMSRVKTVMEAYKQAAKGHLDPKMRKALESATESMPKALIETASNLREKVSHVY